MEPDREQHFLRMAAEQPDILCTDAPAEILEACGVEVEPTDFLESISPPGIPRGWLTSTDGASTSHRF